MSRLLKAHDLITSSASIVVKAADEFTDKTRAPNELWQTDFTYLKVTGWWTVTPTNGQVQRMNRTIKDATAKRYHYDGHEQLRHHLELFLDVHNHARRLKTLKDLTPARSIWTEWQAKPEPFYKEPGHLMAGLNT